MDHHDKHFPGETDAYRAARDELLTAEIALRRQTEDVARLRRGLPLGGLVKENYSFTETTPSGGSRAVELSDLFRAGMNSLAIYSFMFGPDMEQPCPMCSSLIDALDATVPHSGQRMNLVVAAKSPIERIRAFARKRGWSHVRLVSTQDTTYNADYHAEDADGNQMPMMNIFARRDDGIHHFWGSEMLYTQTELNPRHVDLIWPLWNLLDLTPEGRGDDWYPSLSYDV